MRPTFGLILTSFCVAALAGPASAQVYFSNGAVTMSIQGEVLLDPPVPFQGTNNYPPGTPDGIVYVHFPHGNGMLFRVENFVQDGAFSMFDNNISCDLPIDCGGLIGSSENVATCQIEVLEEAPLVLKVIGSEGFLATAFTRIVLHDDTRDVDVVDRSWRTTRGIECFGYRAPPGLYTLTFRCGMTFDLPPGFSHQFAAHIYDEFYCYVSECVGDLEIDSTVDMGDMGALFAAWGGPDGDLDGDGTTGLSDLNLLFDNWGCVSWGPPPY